MRDCGHKLRTVGDPVLRASGVVGKDAVMGFAGTVTCGCRLDPVCAAKIGSREAQQIADTLALHRDTIYTPELQKYGLAGGHAVMVTLTLRHALRMALLVLLSMLTYAWRQTVSGGGYRKIAEEFGVVGWIRALEITVSMENGWHPHLHTVFLLSFPISQERADAMAYRLFERWQRGVRRKGGDALAEHGVRVAVCDLDDMSSGALGRYLSKIGHEIAGSHNKAGRDAESFTMVGLVREAMQTYRADLLEALFELERAIAGQRRKFLTWSDGARELRAKTGHGARDQSDEELAEDDLGGQELLAVDREDWGRLLVQLEQCLRVGETDGPEALKAWLTARGIRWRDLAPAPRRRLLRRRQEAPRPPGRAPSRSAPRSYGGAYAQV